MNQVGCLLVVTLMLTGCHNSQSIESTQTLASVNGDEVSMQQLYAELPNTSVAALDIQAKKQILSRLIERQLLMQEAIKLNLDRTPEVIQAIESSKAQIYAQAYISQKTAKLNNVSGEEIADFIKQHPERFEHRKLFKTVDVTFTNAPELLDIKRMEHEITSLEALEAELGSKSVIYEISRSQFLTDRLPVNILSRIGQLQKGDLLFVHNDNGVIVKVIQNVNEMPMPPKMAGAIATKLISQQRKQDFIKAEVERLKGLSTIDIYEDKLASQTH
ncbi:EpsD family peptidyl-prolyl cis-trans isomerase [Methylophilus sp. QUAN]|uniref:EpsD family peptidyl-prolyl cis-trans isomerase n=1 Tax=Methylophilus sp. QUAN TaxID=2781020 RepID=UPI00188F44EE|nr:EpsD family peptidyl-prolyl cis-trans isomerase [Methylophilus sp. QUAN]MBF4991752.1 peptidyl-prolyl cis-trans isomerase, EpsD family [Methylophilus sp. QUAN]